ncbi:transmembrane and ubiquitin-like domain-containing protein 1, partial [Scomber scombrus]
MALIEGVGDEVTLLFGSLLLLMVLLLAWISTRTSDPPEHLFTSSAGPAPSLRATSSPQDTPPCVLLPRHLRPRLQLHERRRRSS